MGINAGIKQHIQQSILPQYQTFDKAHNLTHVAKVIANSLDIAQDYNVDLNKVYVIAAYHDIGLAQGRENHEKTSAAILLADARLKEWFCQQELVLMAEAVEDHRASNTHAPRSLYGKIVSEADRDIEYTTILTRTIQYSLKNYPQYTYAQHFARTCKHIQEKYGEGGYLKLWLNTKTNQKNLQQLRARVASPETLRADFEKIFSECTK